MILVCDVDNVIVFFFFYKYKRKITWKKSVCVLYINWRCVSLDCCYGYAFKDKPADTHLIRGYSAQTDGILVAFKFLID